MKQVYILEQDGKEVGRTTNRLEAQSYQQMGKEVTMKVEQTDDQNESSTLTKQEQRF